MFIANELSWVFLNDEFIACMEDNAVVYSDLEDTDPDDLDDQLHDRDVMFSMQ